MPADTPRPQVEREFAVTGNDAPGPKTPFATRTDLEPNAVYRVEGRGDFYTGPDGKVNFIETTYGSKGSLNPDLNKPLPNATYVIHPTVHNPADGASNAHVYQTDNLGRVTYAHTERLARGDAYRSKSVTASVGKLGGEGYEGGHIFGQAFGGGTERGVLDPMLTAVNRGTGESYGNLEGYWRRELAKTPPPNIEVGVEKIFEGDSKVPSKFVVNYRVGSGEWEQKVFDNAR